MNQRLLFVPNRFTPVMLNPQPLPPGPDDLRFGASFIRLRRVARIAAPIAG